MDGADGKPCQRPDRDPAVMGRRDFIGRLAGSAYGLAGLAASRPAFDPGTERALDNIPAVGIQLTMVENELKQDFARTLLRLARLGYQEVEFAGYFGNSPANVKAALGRAGLKAPSAFIDGGLLTILRDWDRQLDQARAIGHEWLVCPTIDARLRASPDNWLRVADTFNKAAERAKPYGIRLAYHNHEFEFVSQRGRLPYDVLLERTDRSLVFFELDIFSMVRGGQRPVEYFARWPGRFPMVHITDMRPPPDLVVNEVVGGGMIDFQAIFARRRQAGTQHFYFELESPKGDPMQVARSSYEYLSRLSF